MSRSDLPHVAQPHCLCLKNPKDRIRFCMRSRNLFLAIDVGTGSVRSALVDTRGQGSWPLRPKSMIRIVLSPGSAEQRPSLWWEGAVETTRSVVNSLSGDPGRIAAIAACGRDPCHKLRLMTRGELVLDAVPRSGMTKRTRDLVTRFQQKQSGRQGSSSITANPPASAWQAFQVGVGKRSCGSISASGDDAHARGFPRFQTDK